MTLCKLLPRDTQRLCGLHNRHAELLDAVANHLAGVRRVRWTPFVGPGAIEIKV